MTEKTIVGLSEQVIVFGSETQATVQARIDTGAEVSSIDAKLAADLKLGPIETVKTMKSANGKRVRPALRAKVSLKGLELDALFTIADRTNMRYQVLVGQNILSHNFLVDPSKK